MTLLEVILALGILGFVSSMTYWFYATSLAANREGVEEARKLRLVKALLDRIAREIRQASYIQAEGRVGIEGDAERIALTSYRVPTGALDRMRAYLPDEGRPEYDLMRVEYKIVRHPEIEHPDGYPFPLGLARVETTVPRPMPTLEEGAQPPEGESPSGSQPAGVGQTGSPRAGNGAGQPPDGNGSAQTDLSLLDPSAAEAMFGSDAAGNPPTGPGDAAGGGDGSLGSQVQWDELYAPEIRYLRFCYYDGSKWWDTWAVKGESPLPQLVMVTVGFEPQPPFGEQPLGIGRANAEFCTCLNKDPVDCEPLPPDQISTVVRVPQSDPLFRSRITRETQGVLEELQSGTGEEDQTAPPDGGTPP
ncbi:MAG: hypothetical protein D6788_08215 [Planctomycetota bacterium]|nr:MAG: hypothetical protein D6788_08215 [Planctomycetota bacterium]